MNKLKVLLWAPLGSGKHYWGPGISAYNLLKGIDKEFIEIHLAHGFPEQANDPFFDSISFISPLVFKDKISQSLFLGKSYFWMKKNAKRFDVCYNLSPHHIGFLPSVWFKKFGGKKSYIKMTALNDGFNDNSTISNLLGLRKQRLRLSKHIDGFIALSEAIFKELREKNIPERQILRIPNGVNTINFYPANPNQKLTIRKQFGLSEQDFVIIFTGGLSHRKGPSVIVRAVEKLIDRHPTIKLLIIGPDRDGGIERKLVEDMFQNNFKLKQHIWLIEHTTHIIPYYHAGDIFVLPSLNEGMSNSMLEAMSCGLPVISTNVSGAKDVIDHGNNGFIIERNSEEVANWILYYLENRTQYLIHSELARKKIEKKFDSESILQRHLSLFKEGIKIDSN